jgi:hypothetical protein
MVKLTFPNLEANDERKQFSFKNNRRTSRVSKALKVAHIKAKGNGSYLFSIRPHKNSTNATWPASICWLKGCVSEKEEGDIPPN